jgi:hypothetical protein
MTAPLPLGRVVATPGALKLLGKARAHPFDLLAGHAAGDWGELCTFDRHQDQPRRPQERLLGDVQCVCRGGSLMEEPRLPPGYRLDRRDPDLWTFVDQKDGQWPISVSGEQPRRPSRRWPGKTTKAQERSNTREEDSRLHPLLQGLLVRRRQVSYQDLPRRWLRPSSDLLATAG